MYPVADKLPNEIQRAAFVESLALIGTDQQDEFYSFCEIGKLLSGFSKSMVSLIDSTHQCVLSGISPEPDEDRSWPVEKCFCQHILGDIQPTIVYDVSEHPIFGMHPNVVSGKMTGSYCGFPIRTSDNLVLGTFCLGNDKPKEISAEVISAVDNMVKKLGARRWQHLHKYVYLAAVAVSIHFILIRKGFQLEPFIYAGVLFFLLIFRLLIKLTKKNNRKPKSHDLSLLRN